MLDPVRKRLLNEMGVTVWQPRIQGLPTGLPIGLPTEFAGQQSVTPAPTAGHVAARPGAPGPAGAVVALDALQWPELRQAVARCTGCELHRSRTQTVFGVGSENANLLIIGEAPGQNEDQQGEPFVGRAGQLLNAMLAAIGLTREDVFIANTLKCRPPGNRDPKRSETEQCAGFLERQIQLLAPSVILAVGRIAAQTLLSTEVSLAQLRGKVHRYPGTDIPLLTTYHPAYLLRSPAQKRSAWADLLLVKRNLEQVKGMARG